MKQQVSLYDAFTVGYMGDYAGVTCHLVTPTIRTSSRPKDKCNREIFMVTTTSHFFNSRSLAKQIEDMTTEGYDFATLEFLKAAQTRLDKFIDLNGRTNPNEEIDWEVVPT